MQLEGQIRRGFVGHPTHQSEDFLVEGCTGRADPVHVVAGCGVRVDDLTTDVEVFGDFVTDTTGDGEATAIVKRGACSGQNSKISCRIESTSVTATDT
jgi:hypothetical protein